MDNNLEKTQIRDEADSRNGRNSPLHTTKGGEMGRSESISDIHTVADSQGAVGGIDETVTTGIFKENGDGLHKTSKSSTVLLIKIEHICISIAFALYCSLIVLCVPIKKAM